MTTRPGHPEPLTRLFPTPGPLLAAAYWDLLVATDGDEDQLEAIGDPNLLPRPWDPPTCRNPELRAALWEWLDAVVVWFNHEYVWDPASMIPPCWPHHPHLVHEIAVLADQRRRADTALDSNALEEWHRYTAPGLVDRMRARMKSHCEQDHQPWPARSRNARYADEHHEKDRQGRFEADTLGLALPHPALLTAIPTVRSALR